MKRMTKDTLTYLGAGIGAWLTVREVARRARDSSFFRKTVLVTGGARGLGLALARRLASEGAYVAICARDLNELERGRNELLKYGSRVLALPCDVTDRQSVESMISTVAKHFGSLDMVINNAGVIEVGPYDAMRLEDYEEAMQTHFWAPLYVTMAAVPHLKKRDGARLVNIVSIGGKVSVPHLLPYCASKFALAGLSEGLHAELAKEGVTVTTVFPGLMRTGSPRNAYFKGRHREEYAWFLVSDSLPGMTMSSSRAARLILEAARARRPEVVLGWPAKVGAKVHALLPNLTESALGRINRVLPESGGLGASRARGRESESAVTQSPLTYLDRRAAEKNNEVSATMGPETRAAG